MGFSFGQDLKIPAGGACLRAVRSLARVLGLLVLFFCLQAGLNVRGQSGRRILEPADAPDDDVVRIKTEEILLPVSVRDLAGAPVGGLGQEKFVVFDNGVRQEITSFNRRRVPANIVLLLDASGSVFSQMRFIREAGKRFIQGLLAEDKVCVVQFADKVELLQDWTPATSLTALEKSLDWRYHPGLRTTFYDGLYLAAREQLSKVEGRRIIILLTDGLDTAEMQRASFADALNAVRRVDAGVYVVSLTASLRTELEKKAGKSKISKMFSGYDPRDVARYLAMIDESEKLLEGLAARTGGRVFFPLKDEDLVPAYEAIAEELRTQYIITYKPQPRAGAGEYRRVRVLVLNGDYEVAAREGYTGRG
ncbi:MAG TPA: VWA domain-containing protein [Pyrinomonadaceae bacterium]|nr:VWA domain-containing protein [Pyrinomonadaceae bacterium]